MNTSSASAVKLCIILCAVLIPSGAISAIVAYGTFGTPDPAWSSGEKYGILITLGRLLLVVPLALWILCGHFGKELMELVSNSSKLESETKANPPTRLNTVFRILLVIIAVLFGGWHAFQCLDHGSFKGKVPDNYVVRMVSQGEENHVYATTTSAQNKFDGARWCYISFLPYVMVFYGIIVPLMIVVISYAIIRTDLPLFHHSRRMLKTTLFLCGSAEVARKQFKQFRLEWYNQSMRYLTAFASLGIVVIYDQLLGNLALSKEAQQQEIVAFLLLGANSIFFLVVWYFYHDAWFETDRFLVECQEVDDAFRKENGPWTFLRSLFHNSMSGYTASALLLLPLKNLLPFFN